MVKVRGENPDLGNEEYTQVKTAASAAAVSLDVDDSEGFAANDYVVVGEVGSESCEAVQVSGVTDADTLGVSALRFAHSVDEPVRKTSFNQLRFQYSNSEDGTYTDIETKNIDWQNSDGFTTSEFLAGTTSQWFRYNFYNSQTATHGTSSPTRQIPVYYCSVKDVADWLNLDIESDSKDVTPSQITKILRSVAEEVDTITKSSFKPNSVTTSDYEYLDGRREGENQVYFSKHKPVISVTEFSTSTNDQNTGINNSTYTALTLNTDYVLDKETGRFRIVDETNNPAYGVARLRLAYTWGRSKVPSDVKRLTILMTVKELALTAGGRNLIQGRKLEIDFGQISEEIRSILKHYIPSAKFV